MYLYIYSAFHKAYPKLLPATGGPSWKQVAKNKLLNSEPEPEPSGGPADVSPGNTTLRPTHTHT